MASFVAFESPYCLFNRLKLFKLPLNIQYISSNPQNNLPFYFVHSITNFNAKTESFRSRNLTDRKLVLTSDGEWSEMQTDRTLWTPHFQNTYTELHKNQKWWNGWGFLEEAWASPSGDETRPDSEAPAVTEPTGYRKWPTSSIYRS